MNSKITIGIIIGVALVVGASFFMSDSVRYAIKGRAQKIENRIQLENAVEIREAKNVEMQEKFVNLSKAMFGAKNAIDAMQKRAEVEKAKNTPVAAQKYAVYTNAVANMNKAYAKLDMTRSQMKNNILKHRADIELLKAKLTYLDAMKTMNSYLKDAKIDGEFGTGVNTIVEEAIATEEATNQALEEFENLSKEMSQMR